MFQSLILSGAKIAIFFLSLVVGGVGYITVSVAKILTIDARNQPSQVGVVELKDAKFEGEFKLYAEAENPVDLGFDRDGTFYLLSRNGSIVKNTFDENKERQLSKFFDVSSPNFRSKVGCTAIAFHPQFGTKDEPGYGKFFVSLAEKKGAGITFETIEKEKHQEVIYEFTMADHLGTELAAAPREVLRLSGLPDVKGSVITDLTFDFRGYLYIGVRDSPNKDTSKASDLLSIYGKVLRIDPLYSDKTGTPYQVPRSNPFFLVKSSLSELWSYGLRNPHSVTYDPIRDWVCISDTGQDMLEEINLSSSGAEFFGWNLSEGSFFYPPSSNHLVDDAITSPQIEYARGRSVGRNVGGMIYRGARFPFLDGKTVFADERGKLLTASVSPENNTKKLRVLKPFGKFESPVSCLKTGPNGEIFVFCADGKIFELGKTRPELRHSYYHRAMLASVAF